MDIIGFYPTFYMPWIGSAWVMGIIGVIHVVASHTSVGASFLFALLETKAYRENKLELMDFIKRYGKFLLVFSSIVGSVTGVGILYAITIASPRGTAGLIHSFVWVWAAEWVYFTVEVIGVYALVYLIGRIDARTHLKLTWAFALASWATMLLIVGIISFMMWPGNDAWYQTGSTNDAFYNINFFAQLSFNQIYATAPGELETAEAVAIVQEEGPCDSSREESNIVSTVARTNQRHSRSVSSLPHQFQPAFHRIERALSLGISKTTSKRSRLDWLDSQ